MRHRGLLAAALVTIAAVAGAQVPGALTAPPPDARALLEATTRDLAATRAEIDRLTAESRRLDDEARGMAPRQAALRARAKREVRWLYHLAQGDALATRGGPEVLLDHAMRAGRVRRVLRGTLRELADARTRADAIGADRARVASLLQAAQASLPRLEATQQSLRGAGGGLLAEAAPGQRVTVYGGAAGGGPDTGSGATFGASAGRLLFPVAGRAEVQRAYREGADGPGVEILTTLGAPVRATYPGRVAFADRYGAYGRIVIVDHGEHYYSVSANLGRIDVRVGQEVEAGAPLGTVGDDDGRGPRLYFEIRRGGDTLDPVPWLAL